MLSYQDYLDSIDPIAYHQGEWQWEEDGYTVTRGNQYTPPGCHDSCGILFYTKDGKLEKVEGDPYQPYSGGKLCMRCLDLVEAVNHPDRLKYPSAALESAAKTSGSASHGKRHMTKSARRFVISGKQTALKRF